MMKVRLDGRTPQSCYVKQWDARLENARFSSVANFNLCILLKAKWAVSCCWLPPVLTSDCDGDLKEAFNECLGVSNVFPTAA